MKNCPEIHGDFSSIPKKCGSVELATTSRKWGKRTTAATKNDLVNDRWQSAMQQNCHDIFLMSRVLAQLKQNKKQTKIVQSMVDGSRWPAINSMR